MVSFSAGYSCNSSATSLSSLHDLYILGGGVVTRKSTVATVKDAYCDCCFKEFAAEQFLKFSEKCPNCYRCYDCGHTMRIVKHRDGLVVYHCGHCRWETSDAATPEELRIEWHNRSISDIFCKEPDNFTPVVDCRFLSHMGQRDRSGAQRTLAGCLGHKLAEFIVADAGPSPSSFESFLCKQGKHLAPTAQLQCSSTRALRGGLHDVDNGCTETARPDNTALRRCPLVPRYTVFAEGTTVWDPSPVRTVRAPADGKSRCYGRDVLSQETEEVSACASRWLPALTAPLCRGESDLEVVLELTSPHEVRPITLQSIYLACCWRCDVHDELTSNSFSLSGRKEGVAVALRNTAATDWDTFAQTPVIVAGYKLAWKVTVHPSALTGPFGMCYNLVVHVQDGPVVSYCATAIFRA